MLPCTLTCVRLLCGASYIPFNLHSFQHVAALRSFFQPGKRRNWQKLMTGKRAPHDCCHALWLSMAFWYCSLRRTEVAASHVQL